MPVAFEELVQNSPDIIVRVNRDGIRSFINNAIEPYTGKPASFYFGKSIDEAFQGEHGQLAELFHEKHAQAFRTGRKVMFQFSASTLLGDRTFESYVVPEFGPEGKCDTVLAVIRDITNQKNAEEMLRQSESHFRQIAEHIDQVIWLQTPERVLYANPAYERVYGSSLDTLKENPASFMERVHPEDRDHLAKLHKQHLQQGDSFEVEYRVCPAAEEVRWVRSRVFPIFEDGQLVRLAGIAEDVTQYRRMQEELARREEQYRALVEHSPDKLVRYDKQFRRVYASPEVARLYGMQPEELVGTTIRDVSLSSKMAGRFEQGLQHVFGTGKPVTIEVEVENESGVLWQQIRLIPEFNADGNVETVLGVGRDITDLKIAQIELQLAHDVLEYRIRKRTEELEHINSQLLREIGERERAEEQAKKANEAKNEFLANMSHEIRTPLSGIKGIAEMLLSRDQNATTRQELEMIRDSADALTRIINDLLDLARIESGKIDLAPAAFNLHEVIEKIVWSFSLLAGKKGLKLSSRIDPDVPGNVFADKGKLEQILKNLLFNAIKFTEEGEIEILVAPGEQENTCLFTVRDTGIGIPEEKMDDLFQSFTQLDPSISKKYGGVGLGLIISKKLVQMMSGTIWVESTYGKGSSFFFQIELPEGAAGLGNRLLGENGPDTLSLIPSKRILLAEDNPVNRLFLSRSLEKAGHTVTSVENGQNAITALANGCFDLVLMDIQMPEVDGIEATKRIRGEKIGQDPDLPIIALTAYAMKGDRERFLEAGMNGYVSKPVDFLDLANEINRLCHNQPPS